VQAGKRLTRALGEVEGELRVEVDKVAAPIREDRQTVRRARVRCGEKPLPPELSQPELGACLEDWGWSYISPPALEDRAVTLPEHAGKAVARTSVRPTFSATSPGCAAIAPQSPLSTSGTCTTYLDPDSCMSFTPRSRPEPPGQSGFMANARRGQEEDRGVKSACLTYEAPPDGKKTLWSRA
jgi:acetyl-CoA carboxylase carboxyl transferase subunit beta